MNSGHGAAPEDGAFPGRDPSSPQAPSSSPALTPVAAQHPNPHLSLHLRDLKPKSRLVPILVSPSPLEAIVQSSRPHKPTRVASQRLPLLSPLLLIVSHPVAFWSWDQSLPLQLERTKLFWSGQLTTRLYSWENLPDHLKCHHPVAQNHISFILILVYSFLLRGDLPDQIVNFFLTLFKRPVNSDFLCYIHHSK